MLPRSQPGSTGGWVWTVALRAGLAVAMAVYAITFHPSAGRSGPPWLLAASLVLAAIPAVLAALQSLPRWRASKPFAVACFLADAGVVLALLGLHAFDPQRVAFGLVVVVQAEGGMVLGLFWGVIAWALTSAAAVMIELASVHVSGQPLQVRAVALQLAAGALLAIGGGALAEELSGERNRTLAERERELRAAREAEARFRALVERTPAVTYVEAGDRLRSIAYMSPQAEAMFGYPPHAWTNEPELWASRLHPDDRARVLAAAARVSTSGEPFVEEYRLFARDGRVVWVRDEAVSMPGPDGRRAWQGVVVDITERKHAEEEVAYLAYHDNLTGLPNRTTFEEALGLALARARRTGSSVAVLYLDLDDFKRINDSLGHSAGDETLRQVAARLRSAVRASDLVARHGGDEFLVLLADLPPDDQRSGPEEESSDDATAVARMVAGRVIEALHPPVPFAGTNLWVSASIGIAVSRGSKDDEAWLVRRADAAMYRTKRAAPGGVAVAAHDEPASAEPSASRLRRAIEGDGIVVHYLPVVDLASAKVVDVEALVRWRGEDGRLIPPTEFLAVAESLGLIRAIGERVMAEAFARCRAWTDAELGPARVSVNLSSTEAGAAELRDEVLRRLDAAGLDPARAAIEITESPVLGEPRVRRTLAALHDDGVQLAVDDFGSGLSSLARLRDLPIDVIKLDRPLLRGIPEDDEALALLEAVVRLVRSLGAEPCAEGVETDGQRTALVELGCRLGQGFRFSPPVPPEDVERLVRSGPLGG